MARFVTENEETGRILQDLTGQNAFVTRLPDSKNYRFHHMMKECAIRKFRTLPEASQMAYWNRFGDWYGAHGQYLHALDAYRMSTNNDAALAIIEKDAGNLLSAIAPEDLLSRLDACPADAPPDGAACSDAAAFYVAADSEDAANEGASYARDRGKPGHDGRRAGKPSWRVRPHHELSFL